MNNLEKLHELLKDNPELQQKLTTEAEKLLESKEAKDTKEAVAKVIKAELDIELTQEELDNVTGAAEKMSLDDLDAVAGGGALGFFVGATVGTAAGGYVGTVLGPPGVVFGMLAGAVLGGASGDYLEDRLIPEKI